MIDKNKIAKAARKCLAAFRKANPDGYSSSIIDIESNCLKNFKDGAKWAINEFQMDLWHPMQEEPKLVGEEIIIDEFLEGKRYPMVQKYMVGVEFPPTIETIRWISNWDSFLSEICDEVKMIRWCYFKDLLPKEGGEG
jgi:hypothetical protein